MSLSLTLLVLLSHQPADVRVKTGDEFRQAMENAKPGTRILLAPGDYPGGFHFKNVSGTLAKPIVIGAEDPRKPPRFVGGGNAIQLSDCNDIEIQDIVATGQRGNGLNIDDAGTPETPCRRIRLTRVRVSDLPKGNFDGIKMSGVENFFVMDCTVEGWGGSGIDMVGCHVGVIAGCTFRKGGDSGVQCKGGTSDVSILKSRFEDFGQRGVNAGGSTGLTYFRPPIEKMPPNARYEARNIRVEGCTFSGGTAAIAFVGVDGALVQFNTIYNPERWAFRILQETATPDFIRCRLGIWTNNLIVFKSDRWFSGGANVGGGTSPETFRFVRNFWYCLDRPDRSKPTLPTEELVGTYGVDPMLKDPEKGDFDVKAGSPAMKAGAHAYGTFG